jgi:hypothetical protein
VGAGGFDDRIAPGPVGIIDLIRVGQVGDPFGKADRIDDGLALLDRETASFDAWRPNWPTLVGLLDINTCVPDWRDVMVRAAELAVGSLILLTMMVGPGRAAEQQFSCKGQVVQEMTNPAVQPKPIDLNVILGNKNKLSITTGDGKMLAPRITSNNKIQLKFATKEFVGEYFYYTGDLFLIYNSGQLARLSCSRT